MSKKKAFSGSTMTLKDFHGGSIPSDLPLPSAPGVVVRTSDRSGLDRQIPGTWGNPSNRSDYRSRPGSSGATRNFDDKASFLSHPAHIGRHFDEDERKPLDSFPRRTVPDDNNEDRRRAVRITSNPKPESFSGRPQSNPGAGVSPFQGVSSGQVGDGSVPNAWVTRKESGFHQQEQSFKEEIRNVSRFVQASALEKVSSGKWQSKLASASQQQESVIDVLRFSERENTNIQQNKAELIYTEGYQSYNADHVNARGDFQSFIVDHVDVRGDFSTSVRYGDGVRGKEKEFLDHGRARSPERNRASHILESGNHGSQLSSDGGHLAFIEGKLDQSKLLPEVPERPKVQLIPRTRPMEPSESYIVDQKQTFQLPSDSGSTEIINQMVGNTITPKPGSSGADGGSKAAERPKLNLKPRSQPVELSDENIKRERKTLFGGARPRELVLKERGVDDVIVNHLDLSQPTHRGKQDLSKPELKSEPTVPISRNIEKHENLPVDQGTVNRHSNFLVERRDQEKKDHRSDGEKMDLQRRSQRNEHWRNGKETEKQQERRQEHESWRKPVDPHKFASPLLSSDTPAPRYGRAASALELAQAFSRSVSDAGTSDQIQKQRGFPSRPASSDSLPGQNAVPFSRLTDSREFYSGSSRRQINGY